MEVFTLLASDERRSATPALPVSYGITIEDASTNLDTAFPPLPTPTSSSRTFYSTTMALVLAILGSSVLPMSYAFAKTGILVVAVCNTYTCRLLLNAALATRTRTFEELTHAVGGRALLIFTQASNIVLLFGNLTGDMCLLADLGSKSLSNSLGDHAPAWLIAHNGRGVMLALTATIILPLSLLRGMRALEHVSSAGMVLLAVLLAVLTADAFGSGFRGVTSGEVPLWRFDPSGAHVAEAFALIGFSFYVHPLLMPLLQELPPGAEGVRIARQSVQFVIMGVAFVCYSYIGGMGAAAFGQDTEGDIMMNQLVTGRVAPAALAIAMLIYISSCIPPLILSLRCYLDFLLAGPRAGFRWSRFAAETAAILGVPLMLAWSNPGVSEKAFAATGASGVCIVCYIIPVIVHFRLLGRRKEGGGAPAGGGYTGRADEPLIVEPGGGVAQSRYAARLWRVCHEVVCPLAVLVVGVVFSSIALMGVMFPPPPS